MSLSIKTFNNLLVLIFIIFLSVNSCAQQSISYNFSVDRTYSTLKANDREDSQDRINFRDSIYRPSILHTKGVSFQFKLKEKFFLSSDLSISTSGYQSILRQKEPEFTQGEGVNINESKYIKRRNFLSIPIGLKYYFIEKRKFKAFVNAGISLNFLLYEKYIRYDYLSDNSINKDVELSIAYFSPVGGNPDHITYSSLFEIGIYFPVKKDLYMEISPVFRKSIRHIHQKSNWFYDEYIYSYGINFKIYRKF